MSDQNRDIPPISGTDDSGHLDVLAPGQGLAAGTPGKENVQTQVIPATSADDEEEESEAFKTFERRRQELKRKKRRRRIIVIAVVAAAVLALFLPGWISSLQKPVMPAQTATVYRGDLISTVSVSGSTQPVSSVIVTPEVDGIIQDVRVSEGDAVQAGDVLFTIKNDDLDRAVTEAQQQVQSAQRALDSATSASDQAYASYRKVLNAWNSAKTAEEQSMMQDPDEVYYSSVVTAADSVENAKVTLANAQQALADAQAKADKRTVTAPASGSVVAVGAQNGASTTNISQGSTTPLVQIADLSQMRVTTQVNELDISSLAVGQSAAVSFMALPDLSLDATVERIATVSSTDSSYGYGAGGSATYKVSLIIPNPDPQLKPGMTADALITTMDVPDSLIVPLGALSDDGESASVTVVTLDEQGQIASSEIRSVEVVAKSSSEAAVTGVEEGELVDMGGSSSDASLDASTAAGIAGASA